MTAFSRLRYCRALHVSALIAATLTVVLARAAQAQVTQAEPRTWTVEVYGGGSASSESSGTPISGFPVGTPFTAQSGLPSRAVSSWYFGDGSTLLNQVLAQFSSTTSTTFARIVPLDAALTANGATRDSGAAFGLRIGRTVSQRVAFELNVEHGRAPLALSDTMKNALEESSDSFTAAFQGLLSTAPVTALTVSSQVTMPIVSNAQTRIGGALTYTVADGDRIDAYVTGGGGIIVNSGEAPEATLTGMYTFRLFNLFPINETDRVVVRMDQPKYSAMGLVGGGLTYDLSPRVGLRADVRLLLSPTRSTTTVTGSPNVLIQSPTFVLPSATSPSIQFSTQDGVRSSLSGGDTNLTTFTGSGLSRQVSATIGIFLRF